MFRIPSFLHLPFFISTSLSLSVYISSFFCVPLYTMVKLLTLNCWGLKYVSKLRKERISAIADRLASPKDDSEKYDIVALQEIWCSDDWDYINERCKNEYPYRRIFKSGIIAGPGLAILSKIPIEESYLYRFPINGRSLAFFRGDWYVGKSVAVTVLNNPKIEGFTPIAVLNSHMHAPYGVPNTDTKLDENYSCHRACQAWDFVKIVKTLKRAGYAVIQVGDLNSKPGSLPYRLFTVEAGLIDLWEQRNPEVLSVHPSTTSVLEREHDILLMSLEDQIQIGGVTCDSKLNTWRAFKKPHEACRLDYAFIDGDLIKTNHAKVVFTEKLPEPLNCSYSDHFAYSADFTIKEPIATHKKFKSETNDRIDVLKDFLMELKIYQRDNVPRQIFWRKYHFFFGMLFLILAHFAMPFISLTGPINSTLLLFITTIVGISSVLNGLIWFFGMNSEVRALQEVEMEIEDSFATLINL